MPKQLTITDPKKLDLVHSALRIMMPFLSGRSSFEPRVQEEYRLERKRCEELLEEIQATR